MSEMPSRQCRAAVIGRRTCAPATLLQVDEELVQELAHEHHELVQAQLVDAKPLPLHRLGKHLEVQQRSLRIPWLP